MPALRPRPSIEPYWFALTILGLAALALVPEFVVFLRNGEDIKKGLPVFYYAVIASFLLFTPAWWLPPLLSRIWMILIGTACACATLVVGFQAISIGARWDHTAHAALMQTYPQQAFDFARSFGTPAIAISLLLLAAAFIACIIINVRAARPSHRTAVIWTTIGLAISSYGLLNFFRHGRHVFREVPVHNGGNLHLADITINSYHPLLRLGLTHYNYRATHNFYIEAFRHAAANRHQLEGAQPVAGSTPPRIMIVALGESAGRQHWSLYGYGRQTTPRMEALRDELFIYDDVVTTTVGTQASLRMMMETPLASQPVFPLFSNGGFTTHWFSAKNDQGILDVEISALVQSCDERVYLNGGYDENLLPLVERVLTTPGRHVIFLNLFGSHVRYEDRYPADHAVFSGESEKDRIIAAYDNSIRYTDYVLDRLIAMLRQESEPSCLIYVSDHAEDIYDSTPDRYLFRSDALATNPMYEIPCIVWLSPAFREANADFVSHATVAQTRPFQMPGLYHSLIDLARLTHPLLDPTRSLFSPEFIERERRVGASQRLYRKDD